MNHLWPVALILLTTAVIAVSPNVRGRKAYAYVKDTESPRKS
ncbi:Uncharacterised protein [BD1-7 clade bacterium]|uniref:Uncharacterized protein n=1 Tax=BD1-7 clade bacterium TaxID=2029982 RepID=A0A5S9MQD5_9GAMM|nr:Uncharacterised protein [BD1-7 clade bacterium]CAA0084772.1 Uncharacterised protein [BD1-7 clade bacterium]CAA0115064.1 Uncharacterised protein [BD1-7 clade bacterium]